MFKKWKCSHTYMETKLERYDSILGGHRKFICLNCHKQKWIHIPHIDYYYEKQRINDELGIESKIRFTKEFI